MYWIYAGILLAGVRSAHVSATCPDEALPRGAVEWLQDTSGAQITVEWGFGNMTCNSIPSCFLGSTEAGNSLQPQLLPIQMQPGVQLRFYSSRNMDVNFTIQPYWVTDSEFNHCNISKGVAVVPTPTMDTITIEPMFLRTGINYFIATTTDPIFKCEYGLRLNVTVKSEQCQPPGETDLCHGNGRCVAQPLEDYFRCHCCHGYTGFYCERNDACANSPSQNGGSCSNDLRDPTGRNYECKCALGYYGSRCTYHVDDLCTLRVCENNATCTGNRTYYHCACPAGFTGVHCEVNINECSSNPCLNGGRCFDQVNGFNCFCVPGHGGIFCEEIYNECESSPCLNGGFCVDRANGWVCHCGQGYTGDNCHIKVDLCNPSPCFNATECIDYGNEYQCMCRPGFAGTRCEININECASSPCLNGGRCYDEPAAYRCLCSPAYTGTHCKTPTSPERERPPEFTGFPVLTSPRSHLTNLAIVAGTLAGALLIALAVLAGCYCRFYGFLNICEGEQYQYKKQRTEDPHHREPVPPPSPGPSGSHVTEAGPSADAILEAASGNYDTSLDAPLVNSLKPRRV